MSRRARRLLVTGGVQGIGYRYFVLHTANRLGLTGWVRNRRDGSVEVVVQGEEAGVDEMINCARRGPDMARVDGVDVSEISGDFASFEIRDTI